MARSYQLVHVVVIVVETMDAQHFGMSVMSVVNAKDIVMEHVTVLNVAAMINSIIMPEHVLCSIKIVY